MSRKIEFDYEKEHYVLEYNREAIKYIEQQGFVIGEVETKPATMIELAFRGAFFKNHKDISINKVNEIFDNIGDKTSLSSNLMAMIGETYNTLLDKNAKNSEKNITWKVV